QGEAESSGQPLAQPQTGADRDESLHAKIVMAMAALEEILGDGTKIGKLRKEKYAYKAEMAKGWIIYLQGHLDAVVDGLSKDEEVDIQNAGKLIKSVNERLDRIIEKHGLEEEE
ncbi:MAG: hypothetical protein Q9191_006318, partial [Dirinaria sp. TL-2023a]